MQADLIQSEYTNFGTDVPITETFSPIFWSLILANLVIIALVRTLQPGHLSVLFRTAILNHQLANNLREHLNLKTIPALLLTLTYFNALAIVIFKAIKIPFNVNLLIVALSLGVIALVKLISIRILGYLLANRSGLREHTFNHLIFFQVGGIILTILLLFTHYLPTKQQPTILFILMGVILLLIIVREIHSLLRSLEHKISIIYIILYLCTLELLPIAVATRVILLKTQDLI